MSDLARLTWQCRRGTLELDRLLMQYLQDIYAHSNVDEQALFQELLTYEDDQLLSLLTGKVQHPAVGMQTLIDSIRMMVWGP